MFAFLDDSDETVKTHFLAKVGSDMNEVEQLGSLMIRSVFVAGAVFMLLLTFAAA